MLLRISQFMNRRTRIFLQNYAFQNLFTMNVLFYLKNPYIDFILETKAK